MQRSRRISLKSQPPRRHWSTLAGVAAFVGASVGCTSLAGASAPMVPSVPAAHPEGASAGTYLAGYQATPAGGVASASATFTVPKFTCTNKDKTDVAEFDLGVYMDNFEAFSWINVICSIRGAVYYYLLGSGSGETSEPATAGDTVVTSVSESATTTFAEIHDLTNGQYWSHDGPNAADDTHVDIGSLNYVAANGQSIPTFSKVTLSNASVNGDYLGFEAPTEYNALDGGVPLVNTGALATSASGSTFSLTFKHAS